METVAEQIRNFFQTFNSDEIVNFEKSGLPDEQFQKYQLRFQNEQDPRAYGLDLMKPDDIKKMLKGMTKGEREMFDRSLVIANETKALPPLGQK